MRRRVTLALILGALSYGLLLSLAKAPAKQGVAAGWPKTSRQLALILVAKYGPPTTWDVRSVVWENNGPWLKTVLLRESMWIGRSKHEILQQTVRYRASERASARLTEFDQRIDVDRDAGTMTVTSDSEEINMLALNLADKVASGIMTPKQAQAAYRSAVSEWKSGKSSPLMEAVRFPAKP